MIVEPVVATATSLPDATAPPVVICPKAAASVAADPLASPVILNPPAARLALSGPSTLVVGPVGAVRVKSDEVIVLIVPAPPAFGNPLIRRTPSWRTGSARRRRHPTPGKWSRPCLR